MDGSTFLRVLRTLLVGHAESTKAKEPATIYSAASRGLLSGVVARLSSESPFCTGYLPQCDGGHPVAEGTYLSVLCSDFAPGADVQAMSDLAGGDRAYVEAFLEDPWFQACARWGAPPADPSVSRPVLSDVPTLIFLGHYDPFAPVSVVERAASSLTRRWVVINPVGGHNALAHTPCMIQIRNDWVNDPTKPPDRSCIPAMPPQAFDVAA